MWVCECALKNVCVCAYVVPVEERVQCRRCDDALHDTFTSFLVLCKCLTHCVCCSIDPVGCTDVDDALHVRALPDGRVEVGVHIADVRCVFCKC